MSRVVIDARISGTSTGRYIDKLIEHMHKIGTEHEIIVLTKPGQIDFLRSLAPTFDVRPTEYKEFTFGEQLGFKKQLESLKPDLVHFSMVQQPVWYKGKVVTTMHDLTTIRFRNPSKNPIVFTLKQQVYKWVNKKAARKSSRIIAVSNFVKDDVAKYTGVNPDKIVVTYEAADKINDPVSPVKELEGKQFIMYIGRPTPHKNLEGLLSAFKELQSDLPDLYLVLAGKKDALYDAHERRARRQGINNVVFTGFISDGQLKWLYENTACYAFPSFSEGFGLPGVEAMIHGAPVASSDATCLPEVLGNAAVYFDPNDTRAIGESIKKVLVDRDFKQQLVERGYAQAAKYSWGETARGTLDVYNQVLLESI